MHEEKIFDQVWWFHGHKCAMSLMGAKAGLYALQLLKAKRDEAADFFALLEDYSCMADGVQYTAGTTVGAQTLLVHHHFNPSLTIVRKSTGKGFKLILREEISQPIVEARRARDAVATKKRELDPKEYQRLLAPHVKKLQALTEKYTKVPYEDLYEVEEVTVDWMELAKTPFSIKFHDVHGLEHTH